MINSYHIQGGITMKKAKDTSKQSIGLKILGHAALASASMGANSACMFIFHNPEKPAALEKLRKI